jgi:hypothetical protein
VSKSRDKRTKGDVHVKKMMAVGVAAILFASGEAGQVSWVLTDIGYAAVIPAEPT